MNHQKMLCNGFPSRQEGYYALLRRITSHLPEKPLHSIFWWFMVLVDLFGKMSWAKQSAEAGLAGLSEREAARDALCQEVFQFMPMPTVKHIKVVS